MALSDESRQLVESWVKKQRSHTPLLPSIIAFELRDRVEPTDVAEALAALRREGTIRPAFAVRVPSGPVLGQAYHSLDDIGTEVRDQFNRVIPRDDLEVLPAFERVGR